MSTHVRSLRATTFQIDKAVLVLQKFMARKQIELAKREIPLEVPSEEIEKPRLSPCLIRSFQKHLGVSQREMA